MKRLVLLLAVSLMAGLVAAHAGHFEGEEVAYENSTVAEIVDNPEPVVSTYNSNADELPSLVRNLVSGERINVHIETAEDEKVLGAVMDGARVDSLEDGGVENPTVEFHTDVTTLEVIATAEDPKAEAVSAFNGPRITYETHGLGSTIKFAVISVLAKVFGFLL